MGAKWNILLVDDSAKFAYQVQLVLFTNGHTGSVEIAHSVGHAEEFLRKQGTHIIISDIKLAEGNTLAFIKKIKTEYPDIAIIVLTNHYDEHHRAYVQDAGADFFIDKATAFVEVQRALDAITRRGPKTW